MSKLIFFVGVSVTTLYFAALAFLIYFSWFDFRLLAPNEWGDFLAGSLGPLAIFWLILGFFQQGQELRHSVEALRLQAEELRNSVEQQKQLVGITEKQLSLDVEVRSEQIKALHARDLPFMLLFPGGSTGGHNLYSHSFSIKNAGTTASYVDIKVTSKDGQIGSFKYGSLDSGAKIDFNLQLPLPTKGTTLDPYFFEVEMANIRGQVRIQRFQLINSNFTLVSCDPEQV